MIVYDKVVLKPKISDRVAKLRQEIIDAKPILCSERGLLITEIYNQTEHLNNTKRRAVAFKHILENMTQNIWDDELIVGSHGSNGRRSSPIFPEFGIGWLINELEETLETRRQDTFEVPQHVKDDIRSIAFYWDRNNVKDRYRALLPEETKNARDTFVFTRGLFEGNGYGHSTYQIAKILKVGFKGLKEEINEKIKEIDYTKEEDLEKVAFYESALISLDAVIAYAKRYGDKAAAMAKEETNEKRKKELEKIADVCHWVPENPARDIWEGLQCVQFMQLTIQIETSGDSISPGRLDQHLYPLYVDDIKNNRYTNEEIQELIDCFWLKFNEIVKVQDSESIRIHPGFPLTPNLVIGGQTPDGKDAVNELSYLMLNAQEHVRLTNPQFTARFFENTPDDFRMRCAEVIKLGTGMPAIFGDESCIAAIHKNFPEIPMERVRDYSIIGCIELAARGFSGRVNGGWTNVARIIDLAFNDGVDRITGKQIGPKTGSVEELDTFEKVMEAVRKQVAYFFKHQVINAAIVDKVQKEYTPHVYFSSLIEGCIESGKDLTSGGTLWGATPLVYVGQATAANSLTSIKKYVFEDKVLTFKELKEAMDNDYQSERNKEIQKMLIDAPKYGTDNDFADSVAVEMTNIFFDEIEKHKDLDGRPFTSMILTLGSSVPNGWRTGATADGRNAKMPVSDSLSPSNIGKSEGPTAVLLSASKIDQTRVPLGNVLNLKVNKNLLENQETLERFKDLIGVYLHDLRGQEIQFNVLDRKVLLDAQKNPQQYSDLIVRIAGYSARFVELDVELQNDIIAREEHSSL